MAGKMKELDGASPAKIFIGGLSKDTSMSTFKGHFGKYGDIIDAVIMKDRYTQKPRGFGFITFADPAVVDRVIEDEHVINGKLVEIKRTIPKGAASLKDFKTKKIFVGGLPSALKEDEFKEFFSKFGKVAEHEIIRDHTTNRPRGFGFIVFDAEKAVDDLLAKKGNMIDLNGSQELHMPPAKVWWEWPEAISACSAWSRSLLKALRQRSYKTDTASSDSTSGKCA